MTYMAGFLNIISLKTKFILKISVNIYDDTLCLSLGLIKSKNVLSSFCWSMFAEVSSR